MQVAAAPRMRRQRQEMTYVPTTKHHILGVERREEHGHDELYLPPPCRLAEPNQSSFAEIVLIRVVLSIRQVRQLERNDDTVGHERRAQSGTQPHEKHVSALIAAKRLHRGVVDHLHGSAERLAI